MHVNHAYDGDIAKTYRRSVTFFSNFTQDCFFLEISSFSMNLMLFLEECRHVSSSWGSGAGAGGCEPPSVSSSKPPWVVLKIHGPSLHLTKYVSYYLK